MPAYTFKDGTVYFRQSFPRDVLTGLFVTLYALGLTVGEGIKGYPHSVTLSESEFLSCLELAKG